MPEGAVSGDGDAVPLAPWQHGVFDGPLLEMIEDLIAGDASFPCDRQGLFKVAHIEIADPPGQNLAVAPQFLESRDRIREPMRTAPMRSSLSPRHVAGEPWSPEKLRRAARRSPRQPVPRLRPRRTSPLYRYGSCQGRDRGAEQQSQRRGRLPRDTMCPGQ